MFINDFCEIEYNQQITVEWENNHLFSTILHFLIYKLNYNLISFKALNRKKWVRWKGWRCIKEAR